jgi:Zn-dependent protease
MAILVPVLLLSITVHECAHGWMADRRGDDTARRMGRLSLNPFVHLDLLGTIVLLVSGFIGWAKPVPVNPWRLRNPARDMVLVALAGPAANLLLASAFVLLAKGILFFGLVQFRFFVGEALPTLLIAGVMVNLGLACFNLLPIPPLDGFRVVSYFLPLKAVIFCERFRIAFFILLVIAIQRDLFDGLAVRLLDLVAWLL